MKHLKIVVSTLVGAVMSLSVLSFTSDKYHEVQIIQCYKLGPGGFYVYDVSMPPSGCNNGSEYCGFCFIVDHTSNGYWDGKVTYEEAEAIANANMGAFHGTQVANNSVAIYRKTL